MLGLALLVLLAPVASTPHLGPFSAPAEAMSSNACDDGAASGLAGTSAEEVRDAVEDASHEAEEAAGDVDPSSPEESVEAARDRAASHVEDLERRLRAELGCSSSPVRGPTHSG